MLSSSFFFLCLFSDLPSPGLFFSVFLFPCVCSFSLLPLVPPVVFPPQLCGLSLTFIKPENAMRSCLKIIRQPCRTIGNSIWRCIWRLRGQLAETWSMICYKFMLNRWNEGS
ncbi:hypothetical protein POPTR_013G088025v4 [Populus trichocarpa]|uniref:Uncharacterized protein n=1 Tax=Populus trichocarpa TaxID=3694 RepID=A0ACC0S3K6_POPTR|nr:hypothetical protein POPTR_013G088025v4 [Populus trichocarpa]